MSWNYRVVECNSRTHPDQTYFAIRTAWYAVNEDQPDSIGTMDMFPCADDLNELEIDFGLMQKAFTRPVLKETDFDRKEPK